VILQGWVSNGHSSNNKCSVLPVCARKAEQENVDDMLWVYKMNQQIAQCKPLIKTHGPE
jgi:hypothetical protein